MKLPQNREKIRRGQVWRKRDTGKLVTITAVNGEKARTQNLPASHHTHSVNFKELWLFWERV